MKTDIAVYKVPSLSEVYEDDLEVAFKHEQLNLLLSKEPKKEWIKTNPYANGAKYLPIDKVEYLLKKLFQQTRIEITGQGTAFNGIWVTVRVHYVHPLTRVWEFHDGIGAEPLQTSKGTSPADLANITKGALSIAFPKAKSAAIKDACHHFGKLFGADLNRVDALSFDPDKNLVSEMERQAADLEQIKDLLEVKRVAITEPELAEINDIINNKRVKEYARLLNTLKSR